MGYRIVVNLQQTHKTYHIISIIPVQGQTHYLKAIQVLDVVDSYLSGHDDGKPCTPPTCRRLLFSRNKI